MYMEPIVAIEHPGIPGDELEYVTQTAFFQTWAPIGWVLADADEQPPITYLIPSTEKGQPFGVATLDENGKVVQDALSGGSGVSAGTVTTMINDALAGLTAADVGAHPVTSPVVLFENDTLVLPTRGTHPSPHATKPIVYGLTDGSGWMMASAAAGGQKTQMAPGLFSPTYMLQTEASIATTSLVTIMTVPLEADSLYEVWITGAYESVADATNGHPRHKFTVPTGATGSYGMLAPTTSNTGSSGSGPPIQIRKLWSQTFDTGGLGAGIAASMLLHGTISTEDAGNLVWQVQQAGTASGTVKIYGANTPGHAGARLTLTKLEG